MNTLVIIPAYNEELNIEFVINDLEKNAKNIDCLFIDDGSTDKTLEIIKNNNKKVICHNKNLGYFKTVQEGIKYAYNNNYQYTILFDADRQHQAKDIIKLLNAMQKTNADLVIRLKI